MIFRTPGIPDALSIGSVLSNSLGEVFTDLTDMTLVDEDTNLKGLFTKKFSIAQTSYFG